MGVRLEIAARRRLDAVGLTAIEDGIEIHFQDLILAVLAVQLDG